MIKAIFFDFDMTLVNTGKIGKKVYAAFSNHLKLKPTKKGFEKFIGTRISENIAQFAKTPQEVQELYNLFLKVHQEQLSVIEVYGKDILNYLKTKKIKVIILSNTSRKIIKMISQTYNLHSDLIIGDEDIKKAWEKHQEINYLIKKLKLKKSEVFYVGDHINDIKEGKKAGVKVISVTTGFFSRKELEKYKPDYIVNDLKELINII